MSKKFHLDSAQDLRALNQSEVFSEYLKNASIEEFNQARRKEAEKKIIASFDHLEATIRKDPVMLKEFSDLQDRIVDDSEFRHSLGAKVASAILAINLYSNDDTFSGESF